MRYLKSAAVFLVGSLSLPASAQTPPLAAGPTVPSAGELQCFSRPFVDVKKSTQPFVVMAPATWSDKLKGRGFVSTACGTGDRIKVKRAMCHMSLQGNDAVQKRLEEVLGVEPKALCRALD